MCGLDKQVDVWVRFDKDMKLILICLLKLKTRDVFGMWMHRSMVTLPQDEWVLIKPDLWCNLTSQPLSGFIDTVLSVQFDCLGFNWDRYTCTIPFLWVLKFRTFNCLKQDSVQLT